MNRRSVGTAYEQKAEAYLKKQGMQILERNFRCRQGEIDLIAREGETIVFCEVKYRNGTAVGHPLEAVGVRKQQRLIHCAAYYLMQHGGTETACRFDVIGFLGEELIHISNAFEGNC
ncbi:MAG TPA: YraN family protein [Lachnospiraceae bacterium]|nr:YraN family protein [Lachnospiraceae bacterium]